MNGEGFSSGGFTIPKFGKRSGLTAIRSRDVNNWIVQALNILGRMTVQRGNTNEFIYSDGNLVLTLKNISDSSSTASAVGVPVRASITALDDDYVTVNLWNGTAFVAVDVNVAKPVELRHAASDTIYSTGATYAYSDTNTRTASAGGFDTENHVVILPYEVGREILVVDTGLATGVTASGSALTYIDLNIGGRTWASVPAIPIP